MVLDIREVEEEEVGHDAKSQHHRRACEVCKSCRGHVGRGGNVGVSGRGPQSEERHQCHSHTAYAHAEGHPLHKRVDLLTVEAGIS